MGNRFYVNSELEGEGGEREGREGKGTEGVVERWE